MKKLNKLNHGLMPKKYIKTYSKRPDKTANEACKGCNIINTNTHNPNIMVMDNKETVIPSTPPENNEDIDVNHPILFLS